MQRTIRIQLDPSPAQADALGQTSRQFTAVFNAVCAYGWQHNEKNSIELHRALYYPLKAEFPALVSDLHIQARVKATEALKSALSLRRNYAREQIARKVSQPHSEACPPRYNLHTYRVDWENCSVQISTTTGRQTIRFRVQGYAVKYMGHEVDTADLIQKDGEWWLHVILTVPAPEVQPTDRVIGVDLGINRPAVISSGRFLGQRRWKAIEGRYFRRIRALQKRGSKSAKRHLRKLKRRRARFRRDADHVLSKQIVSCASPGDTIVLENLQDIGKRAKQGKRTSRERQAKRRLHSWPFVSLKRKIGYKAEERGCTVVAVDPRHTSQRCSCCGHTARTNRRSQSEFKCRKCGFALNADLNAARNIAAKYRAGGGKPSAGGLRNQPTVSNPTLLASG